MRLFVSSSGKSWSSDWTQTALTIGRSRRCDLQLPDQKTSSRHCLIINLGDMWIVCDSGSRNGTFVNGERVSKRPLLPGDRISLGATTIDFERPADAAVAIAPAVAADSPPIADEGASTAPTLAAVPSVAVAPTTPPPASPRTPRPLRAPWVETIFALLHELPAAMLSVAIHAGLILVLSLIVYAKEAMEDDTPVFISIAPPGPTDQDGLVMEELTVTSEPLSSIPLPESSSDSESDARPLPAERSDVSSDETLRRDPSDPRTIGVGGGEPSFSTLPRRATRPSLRGAPAAQREAIELGLDWLRRHQAPDGHWDGETVSGPCSNPACAAEGEPHYDVGITALATLAFLGAGHTHVDGSHAEIVRRALRYLESQQDSEGCFGPRKGKFLYSHSIATLAVARDAQFSGSKTGRPMLERAVSFLVESQSPRGGWRYKVRGADSDMSVTGWVIQALVTAEKCGITVPRETLDGCRRVIESVTHETTGHAGYLSPFDRGSRLKDTSEIWPVRETMTASAMIGRFLLNGRKADTLLSRAAGLLSHDLPAWGALPGGEDFMYWHHGTTAAHLVGGPWSKNWDRAVVAALLASQRTAGCSGGSWEPDDPWGKVGGRVYVTALNISTLEIGLSPLNRP